MKQSHVLPVEQSGYGISAIMVCDPSLNTMW